MCRAGALGSLGTAVRSVDELRLQWQTLRERTDRPFEDDFVGHFAGDVDPARARVMFAVQQPLHTSALADVMGVPAWRSLPSWYLVAANDEAIPPDAQRQFAQRMGATTVEIASGHVAMVSHPDETASLIKTAAQALAPA